MSGRVTLTTTGARTRATITHNGITDATGTARTTNRGGMLPIVQERHPISPGTYALTLRTDHHGRWATRRTTITLH